MRPGGIVHEARQGGIMEKTLRREAEDRRRGREATDLVREANVATGDGFDVTTPISKRDWARLAGRS